MITCRTVSQHFRMLLAEAYPHLGTSQAYWIFLGYLMFGTFRDKLTKQLIIDAKSMAELEGKTKQYNAHNYNAETFLRAFARDIQSFEWAPWRFIEQKARVVTYVDWSPAIADAIKQERDGLWENNARVYLHDGSLFSSERQRHYWDHMQQTALFQLQEAQCEEAKILLEYLANRTSHQFSLLVKRNMTAALAVATNLSKDRDHQVNLLRAIRDRSQPSYKPTRRSTRIFSFNGIPNLQHDVRKALTEGWVECDLKNAQVAIGAKLWNIPILEEFLSKKENDIWDHLFERYHIQQPNPEVKRKFKSSVYALMFGGRKITITKILFPLRSYRFFASPLIHALWQARKVQFQEIEKHHGATNCFGQFLSLRKFSRRSILCQLCQAYEIKLLFPVIQKAVEQAKKKHPLFQITLWQHDGFSWCAYRTKGKSAWINVMQQAVEYQAKELGIHTSLEVKE